MILTVPSASRALLGHRTQFLSYEDFCHMWHRWGNTEGLQETWQRRFDLGYDRVMLDFGERLEAAITGKNHTTSGPPAREAA